MKKRQYDLSVLVQPSEPIQGVKTIDVTPIAGSVQSIIPQRITMEPELKEKVETKINTELGGTLTPFTVSDDPTEQMKAYATKAMDVLGNLPDNLGKVFTDYRQPILTAGLFFGAFVGVKLTFALLAALNEIPLVEPSLELIGLAYSAWFLYRYVVKADNRQELSGLYDDVKKQVLGKK
jgi:hypothetical protein